MCFSQGVMFCHIIFRDTVKKTVCAALSMRKQCNKLHGKEMCQKMPVFFPSTAQIPVKIYASNTKSYSTINSERARSARRRCVSLTQMPDEKAWGGRCTYVEVVTVRPSLSLRLSRVPSSPIYQREPARARCATCWGTQETRQPLLPCTAQKYFGVVDCSRSHATRE